MKFKGKKLIALVSLLVLLIVAVSLAGGCVRGVAPVGWAGSSVADGQIFVTSSEGRLVSVDLADSSIAKAEPLKIESKGSFLSCASLGCGSGSTSVPIYTTPVIVDNLVYIAGYNGKIYAYKADNLATQRWVYPREGFMEPFVGGIVVFENKLFIGCSDGKIYMLDAGTGDMLKEYKTGDRIWGTPAIDAESKTLFIGSYDKKLYALSTDDLSLKWTYETEGSIISEPLVNNGIVYFGSFDRYLYAVKVSDGTLVWKFMGKNWFWTHPALVNGVLYAGCLDSFVYALDPANGNQVHDPYDLKSAAASAPVIVDNLAVFVSKKGIVYKIDSLTHEISEIINLNLTVDGPVSSNAGIIYIHPGSGNLIRINIVTGEALPAIILKS